MNKAKQIAEIVAKVLPLTEKELAAVEAALNSRTGQLKAQVPADDWAAAAWIGLQPNHHKIRVFRMFMMVPEAREFCTRLARFQWPAELDKDAGQLKALGVWP